MKRKITYVLLIILFFGGLYFGLRFKFGLFTPYNFWTAQQDIKNGVVEIIEIGELPLNFEQKQKLANSFGFNFSPNGCFATKDILNGTKYYNRVVIEYLETKHGKGWWTKFQSQLSSIDKNNNTN